MKKDRSVVVIYLASIGPTLDQIPAPATFIRLISWFFVPQDCDPCDVFSIPDSSVHTEILYRSIRWLIWIEVHPTGQHFNNHDKVGVETTSFSSSQSPFSLRTRLF
jgi:hypothetical protein